MQSLPGAGESRLDILVRAWILGVIGMVWPTAVVMRKRFNDGAVCWGTDGELEVASTYPLPWHKLHFAPFLEPEPVLEWFGLGETMVAGRNGGGGGKGLLWHACTLRERGSDTGGILQLDLYAGGREIADPESAVNGRAYALLPA